MKKLKAIVMTGVMLISGNIVFAQSEVTSTLSKITDGGYNQVNISYASQSFHQSMKIGNMLDAATGGHGGDINEAYSPDISLQGFGLEYIRGFKVSKKRPMFVEAGLNVNFTFGSVNISDGTAEYKPSAQHIGVNIPISFAYKFNIKNKFAIKPYLGIDLKISMLGRTKIGSGDFSDMDYDDNLTSAISVLSREDWEDDDDYDFDGESEWGNWYDEDYNNPAWKRFNLGWHLGVDFQYRNYNLGFAFISDITKVASNEFFKVSNNGFALKLGYTF